jgi:hypothetical protein
MKKLENVSKHPYLEHLETSLIFHKRKLECLQKRLILIDTDKSSKSEFQKNEDELLKIKTVIEIDSMQKVIGEREGYYINYCKTFLSELEDMENNAEKVVRKAEAMIDSQEVQNELSKLKFSMAHESARPEGVLYLYKKLVKLTK